MRTTLDIADDVLRAARERARHERKTLGQIVSELARRSLTTPAEAGRGVQEPQGIHGLRPFPSRGGWVSNELIARLGEDDA